MTIPAPNFSGDGLRSRTLILRSKTFGWAECVGDSGFVSKDLGPSAKNKPNWSN